MPGVAHVYKKSNFEEKNPIFSLNYPLGTMGSLKKFN